MSPILASVVVAIAPFIWLKAKDEYQKREMVLASSDLKQARFWILDFNQEYSRNPQTIKELLDWLHKKDMYTKTARDIDDANSRGELNYNPSATDAGSMMTWNKRDWLVVLHADGSVIPKLR